MHGGANERPRLHPVHRFEHRKRKRRAHAVEVDRLTSRHAANAGGVGEQRAGTAAIGVFARGQHAECERLQRVAGEQCHGFSKRDVAGGLATAQRVVIHARQVVVDQRIRVNQLHRGGGSVDGIGIGVRDLARGIRQQRAHPLSAVQHRITHRLAQQCRLEVRGREHSRQHVLDPPLSLAGPDGPGDIRNHRFGWPRHRWLRRP